MSNVNSRTPLGTSTSTPAANEGTTPVATNVRAGAASRTTTENSDQLIYNDGEVRYGYAVKRDGPHKDASGQAMVGYTNDTTDVMVKGTFDEASGAIIGTAAGNHKVSDDTSVYGVASAAKGGETGVEVGVLSNVGDGNTVGLAVGEDSDRGAFVEGEWLHIDENGYDSVHYTGTEKGGSSVGYKGHRRGEDWKGDAAIIADEKGNINGVISGEHYKRVDKETLVTTGAAVTTEGEWEASGRVDHVADKDTTVFGKGTVRSDESYTVSGGGEKRVNETTFVNGSATVDSRGVKGVTGGVVLVDGKSQTVTEASYIWDDEGNSSLKASGAYQDVDGAVVSGGATWDSKNGVKVEAVSQGLIDDSTLVELSVTKNAATDTTGVSVGGTKSVLDGKALVGGKYTYAKNPAMESKSLEGAVTLSDALGYGETTTMGIGKTTVKVRRSMVKPGQDYVSSLRGAVLKGTPEGVGYVEYGAANVSSHKLGIAVPTGTAYVKGDVKKSDSREVSVVKLTDDLRLGENPTDEDLRVPANAVEVLGMNPGESFSVKGQSSHGVAGGAGVGLAYGPLGLRAGLETGVTFSGDTTTEVVRGGGTSARLVLRNGENKGNERGLEVKVGLSPEAAFPAPDAVKVNPWGPILGVIVSVIEGIIRMFLSMGASGGSADSTGDNRLMDVSLDLARPEIKRAYDKAVEGDWSEIQKLGRNGDPGVSLERSIFTEISGKAVPLAAHGLGLHFDQAGGETLRSSDVVTARGTYEVESDEDTNSRTTGGLFCNTSYSVMDYSRSLKTTDQGDLGQLKAQENWMTWNCERKDVFTSYDEVVEASALAAYLMEGDNAKRLNAYCKGISAIPERRKFWIGPRNELRNTKVSTQVVISDAGLETLLDTPADAVWAAYAHAWEALNPGEVRRAWMDPAKRELFKKGQGAADFLDYAEFKQVQSMIAELAAAADVDDEELRNDAVRKVLFIYRDNLALVGATATLAGRNHVLTLFSVDSAAGKTQKEFDGQFVQSGADFDVQATVFGEML
ncbi:MAG: hypothetical protein VX699_02000 [Myxococcota bacterium]|nr:hypothetical protein [Myxococcota bacterium]